MTTGFCIHGVPQLALGEEENMQPSVEQLFGIRVCLLVFCIFVSGTLKYFPTQKEIKVAFKGAIKVGLF